MESILRPAQYPQGSDSSGLCSLAGVLSGFTLDSTNGSKRREEVRVFFRQPRPALSLVLSVWGCFSLRNGNTMPFPEFFSLCLSWAFTQMGSYTMWRIVSASFTQHAVFKVYSCCNIMYRYFILFHSRIIFHCVDITHFVYPFLHRWAFERLLPLGYYE